jgi:hypothetical protein
MRSGIEGIVSSDYPEWMTAVLSGTELDGLHWRVLAGWTDDGHMTQLFCDQDGHISSAGGFGGPALYGDDPINHWYGHGDTTPTFPVVRAHGDVTNARATTTRHGIHVLQPSDLNPEFNVKFGAARLPAGASVADFDTDQTTELLDPGRVQDFPRSNESPLSAHLE